MSNSANLVLPYLAVGQAQKHVTLNEGLRRLDAIVQLSVVSATTTAQPGSPTDGQVYIVPSGKIGAAWASFTDWALGYYRDGAWEQIAPREGWLAFVRDTDLLLHYSGSAWAQFAPGNLLTISAIDKVLGRSSSGAGAAEEIACTAAGRALLDDADAAAQRATLGAAALAAANTFSAPNTFSAQCAFTVNNDTVFDRPDDGSSLYLQALRAGGATKGWLGASSTLALSIQSSDTVQRLTISQAGTLSVSGPAVPMTDNAKALGSASFRWSEVFAGAGAINTSDAREKTELRALSDAERRAIRRVLSGVGVFQWLESVATKGDAARLHAGVTAQAVAEAFAAEGLDAARYALWCADPVFEAVEVSPARIEPARPEVIDEMTGKVIAPAMAEQVIPAVAAERPVIDPGTGAQLARFGVRHDQLFAMALAVLAAEIFA